MENETVNLYLEKANIAMYKILPSYFEMFRTLDYAKQLSMFDRITTDHEKIKIPKSLINELTKDAVKRLLK